MSEGEGRGEPSGQGTAAAKEVTRCQKECGVCTRREAQGWGSPELSTGVGGSRSPGVALELEGTDGTRRTGVSSSPALEPGISPKCVYRGKNPIKCCNISCTLSFGSRSQHLCASLRYPDSSRASPSRSPVLGFAHLRQLPARHHLGAGVPSARSTVSNTPSFNIPNVSYIFYPFSSTAPGLRVKVVGVTEKPDPAFWDWFPVVLSPLFR